MLGSAERGSTATSKRRRGIRGKPEAKMKTKSLMFLVTCLVCVAAAGGVYVFYKAIPPKGKAIGEVKKILPEIPEVNKIFKIADLNNDNLAEIILLRKTSSGTNRIYIIDNQGNCFDGWPKEVGTPAIGDVNNDGYKEIIDIRGDKVYAYDRFGMQINGFPKILDNKSVTIPALIDLDKDNFLKIMWGSMEPGPCINVLNGYGYMMPGWPKEIVTRENADDILKQSNMRMPMAVADINNDTKTEVVVLAYDRIFVLAAE